MIVSPLLVAVGALALADPPQASEAPAPPGDGAPPTAALPGDPAASAAAAPVAPPPAPAVTFTPEAQVRPRWEADTGRDGDPETGDVSFFVMRTRLGGTLKKGDVSTHVLVGDVRLIGEELDSRKDFSAGGMDLPVASATWAPGAWRLTFGRMQDGLHEERLMGISDWSAPGRSFDGLRVQWARGPGVVDARAILIREGDVADFTVSDQVLPGTYDARLYLVAGGIHTQAYDLQPVVIWEQGDPKAAEDLSRVTAGAILADRGEVLSGRVEAYVQAGAYGDASVLAEMVGVAGTFAPQVGLQPSMTLWYDFLSGDADLQDDRLTDFSTVYGTNHRYYGTIDMALFKVGGSKDHQGLHDPAVKLKLHPQRRVDLGLDLHALLAAAPLDDRLLAVEPDFSFKIKIADGLTLTGGVNAWLPPSTDARELMGWTQLDLRL